MASRILRIGAPCAVIGMILAACSSSPRLTASAAPRAARPSPAVICGEPASTGRKLHPRPTFTYSLPGAPDGIATTPDGLRSFVALQSGPPRIAVMDDGPSGDLRTTVALPAYASGMRVTPDGKYALAAAGHGVVVLDVAAAVAGAEHVIAGSLTVPSAVAGRGPGAAEIAVSPDSRFVFVTLEAAGAVAVFDLDAAARSGFAHSGFLGSIPVGPGALGIAVSPDGRLLYEVSESARNRARGRGVLNVIDLRLAVRDPERSVIATAVAPCAPVRVAVSPDGAAVWVTAKDANALLGFSARALRSDPAHALVSVTRVGAQPLGLAVLDGGRRVLVADANLYTARGARSGVSVVNTASTAAPTLLGTFLAGKHTDAISAPSSGDAALVTDSGANRLEVLPLVLLP